jgi:hypothetical protein
MTSELRARVQKEAEELEAKLAALTAYVYINPAYAALPERSRYLLAAQLRAMTTYFGILEERLKYTAL